MVNMNNYSKLNIFKYGKYKKTND